MRIALMLVGLAGADVGNGPPAASPARREDPRTRVYATRLREAARDEVNFAQRNVLVKIGCGAGCIQVAAVRPGSRAVAWLPASVSDWPTNVLEPLSYRLGSNRLVVHGRLGESGPVGLHHFVLERGRFRRVER